jgi:hypothetical protein
MTSSGLGTMRVTVAYYNFYFDLDHMLGVQRASETTELRVYCVQCESGRKS